MVNIEEKTQKAHLQWILPLTCLFVVLIVGLWFRTYRLQESHFFARKDSKAMVENMVTQRIVKQIEANIKQKQPHLAQAQVEDMAKMELKKALAQDRTHYEKAVADVLSQMPQSKTIEYAHHYLLGADSYHFFGLTQRLLSQGKLGSKVKNGRYFDPLRQTPKGFWTPIQWHPYLGLVSYHVLNKVAGLPLMEASAYFPLLFLVFLLAAFYQLTYVLRFHLFAFFIAALTLVLSPVFLQRSSFGWYDNDIYNLFFPIVIIALVFRAYESSKRNAMIYGAIVGLVSGIYSYFWVGWPFIFVLIVFATLSIMGVQKLLRIQSWIRYGFWFLGVYILTLILFGVFFSHPNVMFEYFSRGFTFVGKFQAAKHDAWPNVFLTVGEAHSLTLSRLIHLSGNKITFGFAFMGMTIVGLVRWFRQNKIDFLTWLFWILMMVPLAFLALKIERFSLLVVLPLTIFVGFSVHEIFETASKYLGRIRKDSLRSVFKSLVCLIVFLAILPLQILFAHALALSSKPIMNDVWYDTLQYLKSSTPTNSIIQSWWPPGYFITSISDRRVFTDGGTQHHPEGYWQARLFMSTSELESLNILRMLNTSGNDTVEYLTSRGYKLYEAIFIINEMLKLKSSEQFKACSAKLESYLCRELSQLMNGAGAQDPTYLYIYNEMVEKNIAIALFARWDFKRATQVAGGAKTKSGNYLDEVIAMSGGVMKYEKEVKGTLDGTTVKFSNGISFDLDQKQALLFKPQNNVKGLPKKVIYFDGSNFIEKTNSGGLNIGAFIYKVEKEYYSVIADEGLIKSLLFQLYYLDGKGLESYEKVEEVSDSNSDTTIKIFKTHWNKI